MRYLRFFLRPSATSRRYRYITHFGNKALDHSQASSTGMASGTGSDIALHNINQAFDYDVNDESPIDRQASPIQVRQHEIHSNLPPVDGGREAWLFLVGSFFIEALVWGKRLFLKDVFFNFRSILHGVSFGLPFLVLSYYDL